MRKIVSDENVCGGRPIFEGTRIVATTVGKTALRHGIEAAQEVYPQLSVEEINAAIDCMLEKLRVVVK